MDVVGTADPSAAALLLSAAPPTRREADEAELLAAAAGAPAARKSRAELLDAVLADDGGAAFAARLGAALRAAGGAPTVTVEYRGLGVEVDREALAKYAAYYKEVGGYTYDRDPGRPDWYSIQPEMRYADPARH